MEKLDGPETTLQEWSFRSCFSHPSYNSFHVSLRWQYGRDEEPSRLAVYESPVGLFNICVIDDAATTKIVFSPASPWLEKFVQSVFNEDDALEIEAFANADDLGGFLDHLPQRSIFGIEFDDLLSVEYQR